MQGNRHAHPGGSFEPPGEGRVVRGFRLLGTSWRYLREEPRLLVLPAVSAAAAAAGALLVGVPVVSAVGHRGFGLWLALAVVMVLAAFTFVSTFLNVAFLSMVQAHLAGRTPRARDGLRFARSRWRAILGWSAMATAVGALLQALQQLPLVGEWFGRLLSFAGGLAWGLATFFVVPVLVVEGVGARESVRRSARVMRGRWGEAVTADLSIGLAGAILAIPGLLLGFAGSAMYETDVQMAAVLMTAGLLVVFGSAALAGAMTQLYQLLLYQYSAHGELAGPFTEADLATAMKPRRRFWR